MDEVGTSRPEQPTRRRTVTWLADGDDRLQVSWDEKNSRDNDARSRSVVELHRDPVIR